MKPFRSTLIALVALLLLVAGYFSLKPTELTPLQRKAELKKVEGVALFTFEKADLLRIDVTRPDGTISLVERPDSWWIEGTEMRASRQMVNRVKHQLHDLVSRASVVDEADEGALYGLGPNAIHVKLTLRDGQVLDFDAGDPNPSGVSFYIQRTGDEAIFTVKKSAVDYYSLELNEFRERRFASFDSKDVDGIAAVLPGGKRLKIQRAGERFWDLLEPVAFAAADMEVRGLLGRVSAMKAIRFVESTPADVDTFGLAAPRATITITFSGGREPLGLELGKDSGEKDGEYPLAYARLVGEPFVYLVRDVFLDDYLRDPAEFRLRQFARMDQNKLTSLTSEFFPLDPDDAALAGSVTVLHAADEWQWNDGVIVPGSTPRRVAGRAADIESDEFVTSTVTSDADYGFDHPIARVAMVDADARTATIVLGKAAAPKVDEEGREHARWYARHMGHPEVYIVEDGLIDVLKDLHREHGRHARGEAEEEERKARIDAETRAERERERQERIEKRKQESPKTGSAP